MTVSLLLLAFLGFLDSAYLLIKKLKNEKLVCFIGNDCEKVVKSKYGSLLGFPNEVLGVLFYLGVVGAILLMAQGSAVLLGFSILILVRSAAVLALFGSLYLLYVQAFKLKMWCEYCIASALINGVILILVFL